MIDTFQAAFLGTLDALHPTKQVKAWIRAGHLDDYLEDSEKPETIHVFAVGKAAATMAWGLAETSVPMIGHGVIPHGVAAPGIPGLTWRYGAHPLPDEHSFSAGKHWLELAQNIPEGAPVLLLLSGGASSLLEWPEHSVPLQGSIQELNAKRSKGSQLKGGKWIYLLKKRTNRVRALILPDVPPGLEEEVAGSGLAMGADCHILQGNSTFVRSLAGMLDAFGCTSRVYPDRLQGNLEVQMEQFLEAGEPGTVLVGGGECVLDVPAHPGGRCQHAALLAGTKGASLFMALGTDGIDGTTMNAGAWSKLDATPEATAALRDFQATSYLESKGQTIKMGATGTNVNDVWLLWTAKY